jgi:AraC-like DNA-binding protein
LAGVAADRHRRLEALLAATEAVSPTTMTDAVLRTLARMVPAMRPSGERVARAVGMPRRRLHERLVAEGTRYSELLADVRCELARQLLEDTRLPASEIAATLHYSSPGAFSRAFKDWTGRTPRSVRAAAAGDAVRRQRKQSVNEARTQVRPGQTLT